MNSVSQSTSTNFEIWCYVTKYCETRFIPAEQSEQGKPNKQQFYYFGEPIQQQY